MPGAAGAAQDEAQRRQRPVQQARARASGSIRARPATSSRGLRSRKGPSLKGGISVDQELAKHLGEDTVQPSMVLGCEQPITGYHETNFSMAYSSHISWQSATSPVPMEVYPSLAFDSLFDNRGSQRNQSILDRVRDEAAGLSRRVSSATGPSSTSISPASARSRSVPPRCERPRRRPTTHARDRGRPALTMKRPDNGLPEDIREHMRLMCDIIALGFQTDKTRIATLLLCRDISGLFYPFLDVRAAHHPASHDDTVRRLTSGSRATIAPARLPREPPRRHARGRGHGARQLLPAVHLEPVVGHQARLQQGCRSSWPAGWAVRSRPAACSTTIDKGDDNRKLCSMYLSIMDRMGVKLDHFGDAESRLSGF